MARDIRALLLEKAAGFGLDDCWPWPGARNDQGYGQVRINKRLHYVHILAHEIFTGPVPDGYEVDHRCHDPYACVGGKACPHRPCFNYRHLKAVTGPENSARSVSRVRAHCPQGHPYDEANSAYYNGRRTCRQCHSARTVARKKAERAARGPIPPATQCKNGHPFDEENTYVNPQGHRKCRACRREQMRRARSAGRGAE